GANWGTLGASGPTLAQFWGALGASWGTLGASWLGFGVIWVQIEALCCHPGLVLGRFGCKLGHFVDILAHPGSVSGRFGCKLGRFRALRGHPGPHHLSLLPFWAKFGSLWDPFCTRPQGAYHPPPPIAPPQDAAGGVAVAGGAVAGGGLPPPERGPPRVPHDDSHGFAYDHEAFLGPEQARAFDQLTPEESRHRLGLLVGLIDGDGDGAVTAAELRDWMERTRRRARAESVQQGRQRYDRDGDGAVRWDEYRREAYGTPGEGVRGGTPWRGHPIKAISHKGGSP
uniref:Reticulocalbin-3 n=1 Tax=Anser cygnoides TaxID=8845 RepID=A0A8B9IJ69_ANSCY